MAPDKPLRLTDAERDTLAAILARLSSPYDGEVLAAAAALQRFLQSRRLTCRDLLAPALPAPPCFTVFDGWPLRWRTAVLICRQAPAGILSDWDRRFLATIAGYEHRPSDRQLDILATITGNVLAAGGGQ